MHTQSSTSISKLIRFFYKVDMKYSSAIILLYDISCTDSDIYLMLQTNMVPNLYSAEYNEMCKPYVIRLMTPHNFAHDKRPFTVSSKFIQSTIISANIS